MNNAEIAIAIETLTEKSIRTIFILFLYPFKSDRFGQNILLDLNAFLNE